MSAAQAEHWYLRKLSNETARRTRVFDTLAANDSVRFGYVTEFIHEFLGFEIVLVSLLEKSTVYLKAPIGLNVECVAVENSLCLHVMNNNDITVFEDLKQLPEVTKGMLSSMRERVRFYAGFPFWSANNLFIGSVCVMNSQPHQLSQREYRTLSQLARLVEFDIAHSLIPRESEQTSLAFSFKRLNRITDIARDLNLNVTLIRVTFAHPGAEISSMEALSQRIRPWDTLTRLSDKAVLLTLQHRASHVDIADICQRVFAFNSASAGLLQVEAETFNASSIAHIQTMLLALKPQPLTGLLT
ncbi:GAF domain-containing protein [Idiomarina baltica]|uniref:GGDEF domain protein n=1 Tax=Idiomarina baltica OS145 TaxID=314276 RepID=A0ABM9WLY8_9GAMM|nr:GAF domain-containing protein [Idiomarina baltica]EAQ31939.1 GGDEF domain protein [Idiomarina baltica OS145]